MNGDRLPRWRTLVFGFRTRVLVAYCVLILVSLLASILAIRQVLLAHLDEAIEQALNQEVQEFRVLVDGLDPKTAKPFGENTTAIFQVFLNRNIPKPYEYLITLLPDQFYASSPIALPHAIGPESPAVNHWRTLTQAERGEIQTPVHAIVYQAEPITINDQVRGVFVVAISIGDERQDIDEAMGVVVQVTVVVMIVASLLAWILAGQVLSPLRALTNTARSISETDLNQRITVRGADEIAELSMTFNDMLQRLQSAFDQQQRFLNDVGHELRTPITIIQGHLDLMGADPDEQQDTIELVHDELQRMNRLVQDLMLLAKSEQPNFLQLATASAAQLTEEMYAKARGLADRTWHLDAMATGIIVIDRQRVTQAVMNLVQNATKHTQPGDVIALGSAIVTNTVHFWVRDTGSGILPSEQSRIFERFARASNAGTSDGAGLGLSIVQAIAQAHGGHVELVSAPGVGSTFTLILPLDLQEPGSKLAR